jgi:SH3 domain protein
MRRLNHLPTIIFTILLWGLNSASYAQSSQNEVSNDLNLQSQEYNDSDDQFRWVSDDLFTYLRTGPGKEYRFLGSVTAGTKIELLQVNDQEGYAEIVDDRGRKGWIEMKFVSQNQSIRDNVTVLASAVSQKDESIEKLKNQLGTVMQNLSAFDAQRNALNRQVTQKIEDIARLNEQLEGREIADNLRWFTHGALLGACALIIGYVLGLVGRKQRSDYRLM